MMRFLLASCSVLAIAASLVIDRQAPLSAQTSAPARPGGVTLQRISGDRHADRRVALIIGNASYVSAGALSNPVNDAQDMAAVLRELGFEVLLLTNASKRQMMEALDQFSGALQQGSVGVFYYAGHGIQSDGQNYLIPVDAAIDVEQDLEYEALPIGRVLARLEAAGNPMNIVILDACRNNPFERRWRTAQRGLATIEAAEGVLIAYATAPGDVADDGAGRNSPFTAALLRHIRTPNEEVERLFRRVRADVRAVTNGAQVPWTASSLIGDFAFSTDQTAPPALSAPVNFTAPQTDFAPRSPVSVPCAGSVCEGLPQ